MNDTSLILWICLGGIGVIVVFAGAITFFGTWLKAAKNAGSKKTLKMTSFTFEPNSTEPDAPVLEITAEIDAGFIANRMGLNDRTYIRFTNRDVQLMGSSLQTGRTIWTAPYIKVRGLRFKFEKYLSNLWGGCIFLGITIFVLFSPQFVNDLLEYLPMYSSESDTSIGYLIVLGIFTLLTVMNLYQYYKSGKLTLQFTTKNTTQLLGYEMDVSVDRDKLLQGFFHLKQLLIDAHTSQERI